MDISELSKEKLKRFRMNTLEEYKNDFGDCPEMELDYWETFLIRTDYLVLKRAEAQLLGLPLDHSDDSILLYRQLVRERINQLQDELAKDT